jgi:hypothetical protein
LTSWSPAGRTPRSVTSSSSAMPQPRLTCPTETRPSRSRPGGDLRVRERAGPTWGALLSKQRRTPGPRPQEARLFVASASRLLVSRAGQLRPRRARPSP